MPDVSTREKRLDELVKDLEQLRREWDEQGRPTTIRTASLDVRRHPLVQMIREAEEMIERMSRPVEAARGGRPVGASSAPDRTSKRETGPPKRAKLEVA